MSRRSAPTLPRRPTPAPRGAEWPILAGFQPWLEVPLAVALILGTCLGSQDAERAGPWFDAALLAVGTLAGLIAALGRRGFRPPRVLLACLAAWGATSLLSLWLTVDHGYSLPAFARQLAAAACFGVPLVAARSGGGPMGGKRAALIVIAAAAASSAAGWSQWLANALFQQAADWRTFGTLQSPNALAGLLVLALPVGIGLTLAARERAWRLLGGFVCLLVLGALLLTQSKAGLIALAAAAMVLVALGAPGSPRRRALGALAVVGALALAVVAVPQVRGRFADAFGGQSHSGMFRWYCWKASVSAIAERPILGWGPGTYLIAHLRHAEVGYTIHAHSDPLNSAVESGIPATLALLAALGIGAALATRQSSPSAWLGRGLAAGLVGLLVHGLLDSDWAGRPTLAIAMLALAAIALGCEEPPPSSRPRIARALAWVLTLLCAASGTIAVVSVRAEAITDRGGLAASRGSVSSAEGFYEAAARLWPAEPTPLRKLALLREDPAAVSALMAEVHRRAPQRALDWLHEGDALLARSDAAGAEEAYGQALALAPRMTGALIGRAACAQSRGDGETVRADMLALAALESAPYGRWLAVPERASLEFVYPRAALAELSPDGEELPLALERTRGYLAHNDETRASLSRQYRGDRMLVELGLRNAGLSAARENQARVLLARLLWLAAERDEARREQLLAEAERAERTSLQRCRDGSWRGTLVETATFRAEGGL